MGHKQFQGFFSFIASLLWVGIKCLYTFKRKCVFISVGNFKWCYTLMKVARVPFSFVKRSWLLWSLCQRRTKRIFNQRNNGNIILSVTSTRLNIAGINVKFHAKLLVCKMPFRNIMLRGECSEPMNESLCVCLKHHLRLQTIRLSELHFFTQAFLATVSGVARSL